MINDDASLSDASSDTMLLKMGRHNRSFVLTLDALSDDTSDDLFYPAVGEVSWQVAQTKAGKLFPFHLL